MIRLNTRRNLLATQLNFSRMYATASSLQNVSQNTQDVSEPPLRKPRIVKKKYSELPTGRLLPDGGLASPMPPWRGGLDVQETAEDIKPPVDAVTESFKVTPELLDLSSKKARKKRAQHKSDVALTTVEELHRDVSVNPVIAESVIDQPPAVVKPVRRRKTKSEQAIKSVNQPRNQLATEILQNLAQFPNCILLTRVGQFYESYFDQAAEVARLLHIKLTSRMWDGHRILMCGFPLMQLDKYLKVLVQQHRRFIAMCEEFPRNPALGAKGGFDRRVVRVVTPGTLIDEAFLNQYENNFLLAIGCPENILRSDQSSKCYASADVGLAWIDVSTGEFFTKTIQLQGLRDELARIGPRETVVDQRFQSDPSHPVHQALLEEEIFISFISPPEVDMRLGHFVGQQETDNLTAGETTHSGLSASIFTSSETSAISLLTNFLHKHLLEQMPNLTEPSREGTEGRMLIDAHTIKALEIRESMREGGTTGSLLSVVRRTITSGGTRLLARWLCSPSTSMQEINARQSLVSFMFNRPHLTDDLVEALTDIDDISRLLQKFMMGRGTYSDLFTIGKTISIWSSIKKRIELERTMEEQEGGVKVEAWASLDIMMSKLSDLATLAKKIDMALLNGSNGLVNEERPNLYESDNSPITAMDLQVQSTSNLRRKWSVRPDFSQQLVELHQSLEELLSRKDGLERQYQITYASPSLSLRSSPGYGMHVHVARAKRDQAKLQESALFTCLAESNTTSVFFNKEWSTLGNEIVQMTLTIENAEKEAFEALRTEVNSYATSLRRNARVMDELDISLAFANLAAELRLVRPTLEYNMSYDVVNGRHPSVELGLLKAGRVFTPNSLCLSSDSRLHVITGPNMAGKSTFLRQTALIAILAQTGSFVPADAAKIGIVDKVFSRVGAKDDLFRDRSTFMVEMLETAEILQRATPRSLVIMDEVGRGTTTKDGLAVAFATIHHLVTMNRCRTLFATHFHELADMLGISSVNRGQGIFENVSFFCNDVDETDDGYFTYSHRLRPGVNRDSHGLKVAQLAGMPPGAIAVARRTLAWLKSTENLDPTSFSDFGQSFPILPRASTP